MAQETAGWREIVAGALDWEQAHVKLENALEGLPPELRGVRPQGIPHSVWELVQHIRLAAVDLADFMDDPDYHHELEWPAGYWPARPEPSEAEWNDALAVIARERTRMQGLATRPGLDLAARIPWGDGQTYLRTLLVALDHEAYHVGQIVLVRKALGAWKG